MNGIFIGRLPKKVSGFCRPLQLAVGRVGDVLFLDGGVDVDIVLQGSLTLERHAHLEDPIHPLGADPLPEMGQFRTVARRFGAEFG